LLADINIFSMIFYEAPISMEAELTVQQFALLPSSGSETSQ
jgi:hypothetical protein